jgi:hypothetical protein
MSRKPRFGWRNGNRICRIGKNRRARAARAESEGWEPDPEALEQAIEEFRYARDLESGEECDRWLAAPRLVFAELQDSIARQLAAASVEEETETGDPPEPEQLVSAETASGEDREFRVDLLLGETFQGWSRKLAARMALAAECGGMPGHGVSVGDAWESLEEMHRAACDRWVTEAERERLLRQDWLGLTWMGLEWAGFETEAAAREAECCIRLDGVTLTDVARENGMVCEVMEVFVEDLTAEWRKELATARTGDVVFLPAGDAGFVVVRVLSRTEPRLESETVRKRIEGRLVSARLRELEVRHVRWLVQLETAT